MARAELYSGIGSVRYTQLIGVNFLSHLVHNVWLYVFGFATHILSFKAIQPIGKTDIYNVLTTGGLMTHQHWYEALKNKKKGGQK